MLCLPHYFSPVLVFIFNESVTMNTRRTLFHSALLALLALSLTTLVSAQTTYRWTDPKTGKTVISDFPPPIEIKASKEYRAVGSSPDHQAPLPYALQQAVDKFPVVLYTTGNCASVCSSARDLLIARGIPYSDEVLKSKEQIDALAKELGDSSIPSLRVGRQSVAGFEAGAWSNLLDLAGYPKTKAYGTKPTAPTTSSAP